MWIDFSKQRPKKDGEYLVFADSGGFMSEYLIANFIDGEWDGNVIDELLDKDDPLQPDIYWRPLPPSPFGK